MGSRGGKGRGNGCYSTQGTAVDGTVDAAEATTSGTITYTGECRARRYGEDRQGVKSQRGGIWREMEVLAHLQAIREGRLSLHPSFPPPITSAVTAKVIEGYRTKSSSQLHIKSSVFFKYSLQWQHENKRHTMVVASEQRKGGGGTAEKGREKEGVKTKRGSREMEESYKGERRAATKGRGNKPNKYS